MRKFVVRDTEGETKEYQGFSPPELLAVAIIEGEPELWGVDWVVIPRSAQH